MNPSLIVKRNKPKPHYELHFQNRIEFWTLKGKKLGETKTQTFTADNNTSSTNFIFTNSTDNSISFWYVE